MEQCACGSQNPYSLCCGRFIDGNESPSTPEALMRSRYTAYTQANVDYIAKTMKSPAADHFDPVNAKQWAQSVEWIRLDIIKSASDDSHGMVEFIAHFNHNKKQHVLHEQSEFRRDQGVWYYIDGKTPTPPVLPRKASNPGRNEPCLCGSGKKYKKCCGGFRS